MSIHLCPRCSHEGLVFEGIGEPVYDEFWDMTTASFKSVHCGFCDWKLKEEETGI